MQAFTRFRLTADQRHAGGQFDLGAIYASGQGARQDYAEAVKWFHLAEQGFAAARDGLGDMCLNGLGVPRDYVQAHKCYCLAAARYSAIKEVRAHAVMNRDSVAAEMTSAQLAEAQKLAREWKPKK